MRPFEMTRSVAGRLAPGLVVGVVLFGACGSTGGGAPGTGGSNASGGASATGGGMASGGAPATGGANATGGAPATGGASPSGGAPATGGTMATGGTSTGGGAGGAGGGGGASGATSGGGGAGGRAGASGGRGGAAGIGGGGGVGGAGGASPFDRAAVQALMRRVADYEIARFGTGNDNGWVRAVFHTGLLAAYRVLGDAKYRDYTRQWGQANAWRLKSDSNGLRFADNQTCVQSYAELYLADPVPANAVMIAAAQTTFDAMVAAPMAGRTEWWWCDALFMAPPALVRVAQATGKTQYVTLMHEMFWDTTAFLYDPAQSLFWRDSKYRNMDVYWSRGNGWVLAGIARVLEVLPATDARRADYERLLREMAAKLRTLQASDGFWRSSLTQPNAFANPESSGTAFFTFGIAWGINHGILDRATYLPTVMKGWSALVGAVNAQGRLGWVQAVGEKPGAATMDSTNDYATGALLLAGAEITRL